MCILLVEDETLIRETLTETLIDEGFEVCQAATGDQAARLIEAPPTVFLLLMTDIDLPGTRNGVDVARLMHCKHPSLPVLYMTGRPERLRTIGPGEAILIKPFTLQQMICVVQRLFDGML